MANNATNSNLLNEAVKYAEAQAKAFGGSVVTGDAALANDDKPRRQNIDEQMFNDGDVVTIPKLPKDDASTADRWIALPMRKGGDPVLRVLCDVKDKNGNVSVKQLFAGTLTKSVRNRTTGVTVKVTGKVATDIAGCITNTDIWSVVAGTTRTFSHPTVVPTVRRSFVAGQPDRNVDSTVFQID